MRCPEDGEGGDLISGRSSAQVDDEDLARLGRVADAELEIFFARNRHLDGWQQRVSAVALAQGAAEHRLRGQRGIWDIDIIICFAYTPSLPRLFRRNPSRWDWGRSKFGRCPYDPPEYTGRAVDVMLWVIPEADDHGEAIKRWLGERAIKKRGKPDLAHEPVILIRPRLGEVVWDPGEAPPAEAKTKGHPKPRGPAPP